MSVHISGMRVSEKKMKQFVEILGATGGVFTCNPLYCKSNHDGNYYEVSFKVRNYAEFHNRWATVTTVIKEVRKDTKARRLFNHFKYYVYFWKK